MDPQEILGLANAARRLAERIQAQGIHMIARPDETHDALKLAEQIHRDSILALRLLVEEDYDDAAVSLESAVHGTKLLPGVLKRAGMPGEILRDAENLADGYHGSMEACLLWLVGPEGFGL